MNEFILKVSPAILLFRKPTITKHIYKVCKNFTLIRIDNQKVCVADDKQEEGSHFLKGVEYVDYTSPEDGGEVTSVTQDLLAKNFVKFDRLVNLQ